MFKMIQIPQMFILSSVLFAKLHITAVDAMTLIPHANGTYGVGLSISKLTNKNSLDPFNPKHHRSVMLSAFYPTGSLAKCDPEFVDYMPLATAEFLDGFYSSYGVPNGSFESLRLSICEASSHTNIFPLVLFSPGLGNSRLIFSALAQSIASRGYIVVTIDHPYDANVVEYPDGTLVFGANITTDAQIEQALAVRVKDVLFTLDSLSNPATAKQLIPNSARNLNTSRVLIAGFSLGGATAAQAMLSDSRLTGGVNLDGSFWGSVLKKGIDKPFLIFGHEDKNQSTDASWKTMWSKLRGWRRELELKESQEASFSDLPLIVDVLGLREALPGVDQVLGTIGGERARVVISTYVAAFFDFVRGVGGERLFEGSVKAYPEVVLVAK